MEAPSDELIELIDSFQTHGVEFLIVGANALAFHGVPRNTVDVDFWVRRSEENAQRIREALRWFGIELGEEGQRQLTLDQQLLQIGDEPGRVDILTFLSGCDFETAWGRKVIGPFGDASVPYLSLKDFVATKKASGRAKDRADLERLVELFGPQVLDLASGP
jgi:hypothetical protein